MQLTGCVKRRAGLLCIQEVAYDHINGPHRKKDSAEGAARTGLARIVEC
jgi:hypothetical protein